MEKEDKAGSPKIERELIADDEISLIELWAVLVHRWKTVAVVFALCLIIGVTVALSTSTTFVFSTSVELARTSSKLIEPVASIQAKLKANYIPQAADAEKKDRVFGVDVKNPRGSEILVLTSSGLVADEEAIRGFHQSVLDLLIMEQHALIDAYETPRRKEYSLLESQIKIDAARISKLKQGEKRLEKELMALGSNSSSQKESAVANVTQAFALNSRALMEAEHAIIDYQSRSYDLKSEMDMIQPAIVEAIAIRSLKPSGIGKIAIIFLSAVMGLFVGVLAAFLLEFIAKARCSMRSAE